MVFPIRCQWANNPNTACGKPAVCATTTGCPEKLVSGYETFTCAEHLRMFEDRLAATGAHFIAVDCWHCHTKHGAMVLATRPLNEGDLPDPDGGR